jgi:hypothetical protein
MIFDVTGAKIEVAFAIICAIFLQLANIMTLKLILFASAKNYRNPSKSHRCLQLFHQLGKQRFSRLKTEHEIRRKKIYVRSGIPNTPSQ